jgi:hypothetical protein
MTHDDALLDLVLDQIEQDINDGFTASLFDMFGHIPRKDLISYLSMSRQVDGISKGLFTDDEITNVTDIWDL